MANLHLQSTKNLRLYKSGSNLASEAKLYKYRGELLKLFLDTTNIANKKYIVTELIKNQKYIDIPNLVLPTGKVLINNQFKGYRMPFYENYVNIAEILFDSKATLDFKIFILKEVLKIILAVEAIPELKNNFFLGDIYGNNFIWDIDKHLVRAVDMDGIFINGSQAQIAFHLGINSPFATMMKYPQDKTNGHLFFNHNTSMACFGIMLINTLAGTFAPYWENSSFWAYLAHLSSMGLSTEVLEHLATIYLEKEPNDFYPELLEQIDGSKDYRLTRML